MSYNASAMTKEALLDEASDWVSKLDRGLDENELVFLGEFLDQPEARELFLDLAKMSDQLNALATLAEDLPTQRKKSFTRVYQFALAAMLLISVSLVLLFDSSPTQNAAPSPKAIVYETLKGEQSVVKLEDGSDVVLNTGTELKVVFADSGRLAILVRGEAYFDVASDPYRPFSVVAGDHLIQAVGTSFSVYYPTRGPIEVIVEEGIVRVKSDASAASKAAENEQTSPTLIVGGSPLEAGQLGLFTGDTGTVLRIDSDSLDAQLSWRQGKLVFRGETLERALADVSRYTTTEFEFLDEDAKSIAVAGVFQSGDVDGLLRTLAANLGITYQRIDEDRILISRR